MEPAEILKLLISLIPGIISALIVLPITSDSIRTRLFGAKGRALAVAKRELLRVVQEMFLSGQRIDDATYKKLVVSISKQFQVSPDMLGEKDDTIAQILQMINTSEVMPREYKRLLSNNLKKQFGEDSDKLNASVEVSAEETDVWTDFDDRRMERVLEMWHEDVDERQNYHRPYDIKLRPPVVFFPIILSLAIGALVTSIVYISQNLVAFQILACLLSFLLCVSILISLIDSKISKDIEFFRRLIYKIISLMIFMMLLVISAVIKL